MAFHGRNIHGLGVVVWQKFKGIKLFGFTIWPAKPRVGESGSVVWLGVL
jgi:hypothetical protein